MKRKGGRSEIQHLLKKCDFRDHKSESLKHDKILLSISHFFQHFSTSLDTFQTFRRRGKIDTIRPNIECIKNRHTHVRMDYSIAPRMCFLKSWRHSPRFRSVAVHLGGVWKSGDPSTPCNSFATPTSIRHIKWCESKNGKYNGPEWTNIYNDAFELRNHKTTMIRHMHKQKKKLITIQITLWAYAHFTIL